MGFLDSVKRGVQTISEKSDEVLETAKLKMTINKLENQIGQRKNDLGKLTYRLYSEGSIEHSDIAALCSDIDQYYKEIRTIEIQLTQIQSTPGICPACSFANAPESAFCSGCGASLIINKSECNDGNLCAACSTPNKPDSMFCIKCGKALSVGEIECNE